MTKAKKTRGPQDATRRNVQAVNKRLVRLEQRIRQLEAKQKKA